MEGKKELTKEACKEAKKNLYDIKEKHEQMNKRNKRNTKKEGRKKEGSKEPGMRTKMIRRTKH